MMLTDFLAHKRNETRESYVINVFSLDFITDIIYECLPEHNERVM